MNNTKRALAAVALVGAASFGALASPAGAATDPVPPTSAAPDSTKLDMTELVKTPGDRLQDDQFDRERTTVADKIVADVQEARESGPVTDDGSIVE
ncbi:hypothetical protein ACFWCB_05270 [Streptomyces sp. NPDC060048]|uniref:hypothetical protein n=1 Tax=unclassified Streptomyces TaxID=2593676 RepID=UPI0036BECD10